jgi:hypothetical protein
MIVRKVGSLMPTTLLAHRTRSPRKQRERHAGPTIQRPGNVRLGIHHRNTRHLASAVDPGWTAPPQMTCPMSLAMTPGYPNTTTRRSPAHAPDTLVRLPIQRSAASAGPFCFAMANRASEARVPLRTSRGSARLDADAQPLPKQVRHRRQLRHRGIAAAAVAQSRQSADSCSHDCFSSRAVSRRTSPLATKRNSATTRC